MPNRPDDLVVSVEPRNDGGAWSPEWDRLIAERIEKMPPPCEHDFSGWREFDDGRGGEQFCQKCGYGAMAWSMRMLP